MEKKVLATVGNKEITSDYIDAVSYTHLDVYKRQALSGFTGRKGSVGG